MPKDAADMKIAMPRSRVALVCGGVACAGAVVLTVISVFQQAHGIDSGTGPAATALGMVALAVVFVSFLIAAERRRKSLPGASPTP